MAIADYDALTQFEVEARKGRAEALYNLAWLTRRARASASITSRRTNGSISRHEGRE
jgi:hypothetical protein